MDSNLKRSSLDYMPISIRLPAGGSIGLLGFTTDSYGLLKLAAIFPALGLIGACRGDSAGTVGIGNGVELEICQPPAWVIVKDAAINMTGSDFYSKGIS